MTLDEAARLEPSQPPKSRVAAPPPVVAAVRPAQFLTIGGICAAGQLGLLALLQETTGLGSWSNAIAFLVASQVNFGLNYTVTWRDRMAPGRWMFVRQLLGFNVLVAAALPVNQGAYLLSEMVAPYLVAGVVGIGATTLAKYLIADRWIFPRPAGTRPSSAAPATAP